MKTREKMVAVVVVALILLCSHRMAYLMGFQKRVIAQIKTEILIEVQTYLKGQGVDLKLNSNTN